MNEAETSSRVVGSAAGDKGTPRPPHDHFIARKHMRGWATANRVTVMKRGRNNPTQLDIGRKMAAEMGLNDPAVESSYAKVENSFARALQNLLDPDAAPTEGDWKSLREYAVLVHDRYPALRGSPSDPGGSRAGHVAMPLDPQEWGQVSAIDSLAEVKRVLESESPKARRMQLLPLAAERLPPYSQLFRAGPMVLGDAGIHAISVHTPSAPGRSYIAMPLNREYMAVFGQSLAPLDDIHTVAATLRMKIILESTVLVDTIEAPLLSTIVPEIWESQERPHGKGLPSAVRVFSDLNDIRAFQGQPPG